MQIPSHERVSFPNGWTYASSLLGESALEMIFKPGVTPHYSSILGCSPSMSPCISIETKVGYNVTLTEDSQIMVSGGSFKKVSDLTNADSILITPPLSSPIGPLPDLIFTPTPSLLDPSTENFAGVRDTEKIFKTLSYLKQAYDSGVITLNPNQSSSSVSLYHDYKIFTTLQRIWLMLGVFSTINQLDGSQAISVKQSPRANFVFECIGRSDLSNSLGNTSVLQEPHFSARITSIGPVGLVDTVTISLPMNRGLNVGGAWVTSTS